MNVPRMLPAVDSAYILPATSPAFSTLSTPSLTANGDAIPSRVMGTEKIAIAAKNDPRNAPTDALANASTATLRSGSARNGVMAIAAAASSISRARYGRCGWRSASRPPRKYPAAR